MTEIEKKIRHINYLNNQITFKFLPAISESLGNIRSAHKQLMDNYAKLVELQQPTQPPSEQRDSQENDSNNE